jgi:hypothetical protein
MVKYLVTAPSLSQSRPESHSKKKRIEEEYGIEYAVPVLTYGLCVYTGETSSSVANTSNTFTSMGNHPPRASIS